MARAGEKCSNCKFYLEVDDTDEGNEGCCRRYPPQLDPNPIMLRIQWLQERVPISMLVNREEKPWDQPDVSADGWCGEWKTMDVASA
jgi:hypothetical protein